MTDPRTWIEDTTAEAEEEVEDIAEQVQITNNSDILPAQLGSFTFWQFWTVYHNLVNGLV